MANITRENVVPSLIENTIMQKLYLNGVPRQYVITPVDGYVLHDNMGDWVDLDPITGEETEMKAYYRGSCSCPASYDFVANPREFYVILEK